MLAKPGQARAEHLGHEAALGAPYRRSAGGPGRRGLGVGQHMGVNVADGTDDGAGHLLVRTGRRPSVAPGLAEHLQGGIGVEVAVGDKGAPWPAMRSREQNAP